MHPVVNAHLLESSLPICQVVLESRARFDRRWPAGGRYIAMAGNDQRLTAGVPISQS